jgi:hypothetical protein
MTLKFEIEMNALSGRNKNTAFYSYTSFAFVDRDWTTERPGSVKH